MIDISKTSQTTIIITTHYIEEARKADRVGLIRNGRILAENSPEFLLETYCENVNIIYQNKNNKIILVSKSLENVFLKLCIKDESIPGYVKKSNGLRNPLCEPVINEVVKYFSFK